MIKDIDIKKVNGVPQYAFVQYSDIASVCKAIKKMDGEYLGSNRLKVLSFKVKKKKNSWFVICVFSVEFIMCIKFPPLEAWVWKKYADNVRLAGWFGDQYHRAIPHSAFLSLWTCCEGMVSNVYF